MEKRDWLIIGGLGVLALVMLARRSVAKAKPGARVVVAKRVAEKAGVSPEEELSPGDVAAIQGQLYKVPESVTTATLAPFTVKVGKTITVPMIVPVKKGVAGLGLVPVQAVKKALGWAVSVTVEHPTYAQLAKQKAAPTPSQEILQALYGTKRTLPPSVASANVVTQRGIATQARPFKIIGI